MNIHAVTRRFTSRMDLSGGRIGTRIVSDLFFCLVIALVIQPAFAHDEYFYIGAQAGTTSASLNNIRDVGGSFEPGTTATEPDLDNSNLIGVKTGFYSRSGLLGTEVEYFQTKPDIKNQSQTFFEPTFGPFVQTRGGSQKVTTVAVNVIARLPISKKLIARIGIGPAWSTSKINFDGEQPQEDSDVGLNSQLGLDYFISKYALVSVDWKYNSAQFRYPTHGTTEGFNADYKSNSVAVGFNYAFDWSWPWTGPNLRGKLGMDPVVIGPEE